jgi:hypothetical protein
MTARASFASAFLLCASVFTAGVARADDDARPAAPKGEPEIQWTGWQTLVVDAGWLGLTVATAPKSGPAATAIALSGYSLGGPIVHVVQGRSDAAWIDLAVRVGAPLVAGALGYGIGVASFGGCSPGEWLCGRDFSGLAGASLGVLVAGIGAIVFDAAALGRERVAHDGDTSTTPPPAPVRWSPHIAVSPRGEPSVGVGGAF